MRYRTQLVSGVALAWIATLAVAQPRGQVLQTVQDMPVLHGYGAAKFDVIDLRFGDTREDVTTVLEKAYPGGKLQPVSAVINYNDNRGNRVAVQYDHSLMLEWRGPEANESVHVQFASALTGGRLFAIKRVVQYSQGHLGNMAELRRGIAEKYGEPNYIGRYDHQGRIEIVYTWEKRPVRRIGEDFVQQRSVTAPDPTQVNACLEIAGYGGYVGAKFRAYAPGQRADNPGQAPCIGGLNFKIFFGKNPNTVSRLQVEAMDYNRAMTDARLLDAKLLQLVEEQARAVQGVGRPKL